MEQLKIQMAVCEITEMGFLGKVCIGYVMKGDVGQKSCAAAEFRVSLWTV